MSEHDLALVAHLMRRAGFGASRAELDLLAAKGYEAVVDDLRTPKGSPLSTRISCCAIGMGRASTSPPALGSTA